MPAGNMTKQEKAKNDRKRFDKLLEEIAEDPRVLQMKAYTQHGKVTTYDHCRDVASASLRLGRLMHLKVDEAAAIARCTGRYISMLCQTGAIQAVKLGKGWRISKNSFFDYLGIGR